MADKSSSLQLFGTPLGFLAVVLAEKEWAFTVAPTGSLYRYVEVYALDSTNAPCAFQWSNATGGTFNIVPAGTFYTLPVFKVQSYFFKRLTLDCSLYGTCVG